MNEQKMEEHPCYEYFQKWLERYKVLAEGHTQNKLIQNVNQVLNMFGWEAFSAGWNACVDHTHKAIRSQ